MGTSLAVQWLRLCTSTAGGADSSLAGELRSHMPRGVTRKKKERKSYDLPKQFKNLEKEQKIKPK